VSDLDEVQEENPSIVGISSHVIWLPFGALFLFNWISFEDLDAIESIAAWHFSLPKVMQILGFQVSRAALDPCFSTSFFIRQKVCSSEFTMFKVTW
jgi:hypothetical protein